MPSRIFVIDPFNEIPDENIHSLMGCHIGELGMHTMGWTRETETPIRTDAMDLETLAALSGQYPSKTEARRKGLCGPIPFGVNAFGRKGGYIWFWVWNPTEPASPPTIAKGMNKTEGAFRFEWSLRHKDPPLAFVTPSNSHVVVQPGGSIP